MLKTRIYSYAPEHWGRYQKVMFGVLASNGRPADHDTPFGLGNEIWIESEPWPYVQAPEDEEARTMAVAVQHKHEVRRAFFDFHCTDPGQEELVLATVHRPDLKHLHFDRHCTFSDEFFQQLGAEVTNLESLELKQRYFAAPYCSGDACDIGVSRMIRNSAGTLRKLSIKMERTERTLQAIRACTNLKELELTRSDMELIDLRFVPVEVLTLNACKPMFWDVFFENQVSPNLRQLFLKNIAGGSKMSELIYALCKTVQKLEHLYLGFQTSTYLQDDMKTALSLAIQGSETLTSFAVEMDAAFGDLPGFEQTDKHDFVLYTKIV
jgi:hypothetical protein